MAYDEIYDHFGKDLVVLFPQMVQLAHDQMHRYQLGATPRTGWKGALLVYLCAQCPGVNFNC